MLTTNSPGEVAAWLAPAVRELRRLRPSATISVFIPPCSFASGSESAVVRRLEGIHRVYGPAEFVQYALGGKRPVGFHPQDVGVVCFLGGDQLYGALLARRLHYPAVAYTEGRAQWRGTYRLFMVPDEAAKRRALSRGATTGQVAVIGDLMLDAVQPHCCDKASARKLFGLSEDGLVVSLFPGSRPFELRLMLPFLLQAARSIATSCDMTVHFLVSIAPFVTEQVLMATVDDKLQVQRVEGPHGLGFDAWQLSGPELTVMAHQGLQYDIMMASDLAITVPGSNTAEMAALGLPMVVALPLNNPEEIPLEGLPGLVGQLPWVGAQLKRLAVLKVAQKVRFAALCNRKANEEIVPEVKGHLAPEDVVAPALELLRSPERRRSISKRLVELMGAPGAAERLATAVVAMASTTRRKGG